MRLSGDFCRAQAERQRVIAAAETLENRCAIALLAAKSWEEAATLADKTAAPDGGLDELDTEIALEFARETSAETSSEA